LEPAELDNALEELELRLERLRALYEQYFLGIERIEPQVARKDVDRRVYVLRREKIRNTGKRFKLQTLIQRYNTFQQYWQRICREIENGTYKRHLLRAEKLVGKEALTAAARKRLGRDRAQSEPPPSLPPPELDASADLPTDQLPRARTSDVAEARQSAEPPRRASSAAMKAAQARARHKSSTPPEHKSVLPGTSPPPRRALSSPPPGVQVPRDLADGPKRPSTRPRDFESLELDMDFMGDWDPQTSTKRAGKPPPKPEGKAKPPPPPRAPIPPPPAADPPPFVSPPRAPNVPGEGRRLAPPPKPGRPGQAPMSNPTPPGGSVPPIPNAPILRRRPSKPTPPLGTPSAPPPAPALAPPLPARAPVPRDPRPAARTQQMPSVRPPAAPEAALPPTPAAPPVQRQPTPPTSPRAAPAPIAPTPARPEQRPVKPAAKPAAAEVTDARLREVHARFVEASKTAGAPGVSFDGLAKSLRATEAKLRAQHGNRRIDFEVILKDGKPIVKPIVR